MAKLAFALLVLTIGGIAALWFMDYQIPIGQDESVQRDIRLHTTPAAMNKHINDAIQHDDIDDATMYSDIADYAGIGLSPQTEARLKNATSTVSTVVRDTGQFATGLITGEGTSMAGIAGAVTSDLTVVGDVRDIASEGSAMVQGKPYSELMLGLSVVGVAATAATVATGGGGVVAKLGVSVLKVAKRAGTLTVDFARTLTRLTRDAVNFPEFARVLRGVNLSDIRATERAVGEYARSVRGAELFPVINKLADISRTSSPSEAVRMMKFVRTTENLDDVAAMSARFGKKSRGIMEITGKTALRLFKTTMNILEFLIEKIIWLLGWLASLVGLSATKRVFRGVRSAAAGGGGGGLRG